MEPRMIVEKLTMMAFNFGLVLTEEYFRFIVPMLQKNLSKAEFLAAVECFMSQKTMPRMPSIAEWKDAAGQDTRTLVSKQETEFLEKVSLYLASGFISRSDKTEFLRSLTDTELSTLQRLGGISELWSACHRPEYPKSLNSILHEVRETFREVFEQNSQFSIPAIGDGRIQTLLAGTVKKLN